MNVMIGNIKVLVELFAYLYCLAELFGKKLRLNVYVVVLVITDMFLATAINQKRFPVYFSTLLYLCVFLYALSCYKESVLCTLVNCILSPIIMTFFQLIAFLPFYHLYYKKYHQMEMNELLIMIACFLLIIIFSYKLEFKKLSDFCVKRNGLIICMSILILLGLAMSIYQIKSKEQMSSEIYIQMIYFIFIFAFVIYEWQKSRVDAEKKKTQLDMNSLYYDAYDQLIMLIRERQHDMKNHINTITNMIYTIDNYDELVEKQTEYCNHVMDISGKTKLVLSVANPLIAGFLYSKIQEAEEKQIEFDYRIDVPKTTSVIPEYELIEMSGILIDNAIEALGVEDSANLKSYKKKINVSMKETENMLELVVANTSDCFTEDITEDFFEAGYSSKGKGRGIGLSKLKRMVHERMGDIVVSNEKYNNINYLQFCISIPIQKKNKKNS